MRIGTARPTLDEMKNVPHHFIDFLSVREEMSAGSYESAANNKLNEIFLKNDKTVLVGGSGLYVQAVCEGMNEMPEPPTEFRNQLIKEWKENGLEVLQKELKDSDREYYHQIDQDNHQRVIRALEMIRFTGMPFSNFRTGQKKKRNFHILKIGLEMERDQLYDRINRRVDIMLENGLEEEARDLYHLKNLNALQTVGYKEFFDCWDGKYDREEAIRLIKRNSRRYAKRQMTWFKKDEEIDWFNPNELEKIVELIDQSAS
jgi:tRNA dimethylallyltransferase